MQQVIRPQTTGNLLDAALKAWWAGISIIPIGANKIPAWHFMPLVWDEKKGKEVPTWKPYQENRATLKEVETWFSPENIKRHGVTGAAAIGGKISSNLLMFDFDRGDEAFDLWYPCVQREIKGARVERTGEGWRVYVRLSPDLSIRNAKLAEYLKPDGKTGCIIELKGEGGYALFAPSQYPRLAESKFGRTNDSYELVEGDWDLPIINSNTLDYLMLAAREFDELNYDDPRPKRIEPPRPAYTGGGIPNNVVEDAGKEVNGFLKKCEASDWGSSFISWGRMAAWATAIEAGLGNPGFVWEAFAAGSKRHPAYDSKQDDARLDDMRQFTPSFNVSWFAYNLTYNLRHKQCLPRDQRYILQGDVWQPQQTIAQERAPEDLRRPGDLSLGGQAPAPVKSIEAARKVKRTLKLSDLRMRPPKEYMDRYPFPKYRKTFVWGASGTGKTLLAVDAMMFAIAEEGANVYCIVPAEECAEEYVYRIDAWLEAYDQYKPDVENRIEFWNDDITLDFRDPNCIKMIMDEISGKDIDYLLIDTMAALLPGIKDSDNGDFREFFTNIGRLQVGTTPGVKRTVVVLGHANRKGEYKSASAIRDSVDAMFSLVEEGGDKIKLSCEKMRGGGRPKPMMFKRTLSPKGTSAYLQRVGDAEPREYDQSLTVNQFAVLDIFTLEPYREAISREALEKNLDIKAGPGQRQLSLDIDKLIKVGYIHHLDGDQIRELKKRGIVGNMQITNDGGMAYDAYRRENAQPIWSYSEPLDDSAMAGVGAFLRFRLKVDPEAYEVSQDLFEAYQTFCSESDIKYSVLTSISPFVKHLRGMKPGLIVPDRKKDQRIIKGVKIK